MLSVLTTLNLPAVVAIPSVRCLQWTGDGQLLLLTRNALHILTPDPGVKVELASIIKSVEGEDFGDSIGHVGWLRTMIEFNKTLIHQWPADCQDWDAVSLSSIDPYMRAVTYSPSNITADSGCVIAILNSNMELSLWIANKNHLKGEWTQSQDVTEFLKGDRLGEGDIPMLQRVLQTQVTCIEWSSNANFGLSPSPGLDGSLLAAGNRAGSLHLLRLSGISSPKIEVQRIATISVSDRWITNVAWSPWAISINSRPEAYVACGIADGSVILVKVAQDIHPEAGIAGFMTDYTMVLYAEVQGCRPCEADSRGITALKWVDVPGLPPILAYCKPGALHLWFQESSGSCGDSRVLSLTTQRSSVGSSALHQVTGITYVRQRDTMLLTLADGSFHVVEALSTDPVLRNSPAATSLSSSQLTAASREMFVQVESLNSSKLDVNCIAGATSYDGNSVYTWIHEATRPTDFSYKPDAKRNCVFVVAQMWKDNDEDVLLSTLREKITSVNCVVGESPISLLRPVLLHLRNPRRSTQLYSQVLEILQESQWLNGGSDINIASWDGHLDASMRNKFKRSLAMHMFGLDVVLAQRLKFITADFCQNCNMTPELQQKFKIAAASIRATIWQYVLRTIIRHINAVLRLLTIEDVPFVLRIVVQALQPEMPADLLAEAETLSLHVNAIVPPESVSSHSLGLDELCPACHVPVPIQEVDIAKCSNGHVWARCCVTSFILSIPMVRTCMGCGRKAFLPLGSNANGGNWLPAAARSWLIEDLLEAVRRCFFCGSDFVTLI